MSLFQKSKNLSLGEAGEQAAAKYLKKKGYKIREKNYKNASGRRIGEIDVIAKDGGCLVFIEVKTRSNNSFGLPEENINRKKLFKLRKIAEFYIKKNGLWNTEYRFDAISATTVDGKNFQIKHLENIFIDNY